MQKNMVLKGLLAVSAVAAMFSAFGVNAQTSTSGQSATGDQTLTGKTNNTNEDERGASPVAGGKAPASSGASSSSGSSGMSGQSTSGTSSTGSQTMVGKTNNMNQDERGAAPVAGGSSNMKDQNSGMSGASGAAGAAASGGSMSKADQKILMNMAQANINEVEAGKLAQSKSQNDQVKSFAQQMIDDHSKALTEVQTVAQQKSVTLPTEPDAKHKAMAAKLEKMSGDAFDKAYMSQAGVADHKKVHSMLVADSKRAKDPDVKALAGKMTPVVEQHLKSAQQMPTPKSGTTAGK
jgi:putative membrane protein